MYKVLRDEKRVWIVDWKNTTVYSVDREALILYEGAGGATTDKVSTLTDDQLLIALVTMIKLPL